MSSSIHTKQWYRKVLAVVPAWFAISLVTSGMAASAYHIIATEKPASPTYQAVASILSPQPDLESVTDLPESPKQPTEPIYPPSMGDPSAPPHFGPGGEFIPNEGPGYVPRPTPPSWMPWIGPMKPPADPALSL